MNKSILCPTCGKIMKWDKTNPYRPFCSQRCKLIDLGQWASESHRIPGEELGPENIEDKSSNH